MVRHFYFDGYRLIDSLVTFFSNEDATGQANIELTLPGRGSTLDKRNVL